MINLFLDSGAYSLYHHCIKKSSKGKSYTETDEFWNYVDQYAEYIKENGKNFSVYVNVDVIFNPQESLRVQKYLESKHKLNPMPVYHFGEDIKWFKKYMDNHEYIGISGVGKETPRSAYIDYADTVFNLVCRGNNNLPEWKIHGFAMTSPSLLFRYPWYSTDSSSWVQYSRFGAILLPRTFLKKRQYSKSPEVLFVSLRSPKQDEVHGRHYVRLGRHYKSKVREYIREMGFQFGKSEIIRTKGKIKEIVLKDGLCNNHKLRDRFNLIYFLEIEKNMPLWPQTFIKQPTLFGQVENARRKYEKEKMRLYFAGNFPQLKDHY